MLCNRLALGGKTCLLESTFTLPVLHFRGNLIASVLALKQRLKEKCIYLIKVCTIGNTDEILSVNQCLY